MPWLALVRIGVLGLERSRKKSVGSAEELGAWELITTHTPKSVQEPEAPFSVTL